MQVVTVKLNKYNGGISDDVRDQANGVFAISRNFDIFSNPDRLTPYRDVITAETISATSSTMTAFEMDNVVINGSSKIFALCEQDASHPAFFRVIETSDLNASTMTWALSASSSQTTTGAVNFAVAVVYKDYLYGMKTANGSLTSANPYKYGPLTSGVRVLTENVGGDGCVSGTTTGNKASNGPNGIIGDDDNLYIPFGKVLVRVQSNDTVTDAALTLPFTITSLTKWGKYLAIATIDSVSNKSFVYLWDYVSDDVSEVVDFGQGQLLVLENLEGALVGVVAQSASLTFNKSTSILRWAGGTVDLVKQIPFSGLLYNKQKRGSRLYFILSDGTTLGVWAVGRVRSGDPLAVTFDRYLNNDTAVSTLNAFLLYGDYLLSSIGSGSVRRTSASAAYTSTAKYESQKLNGGDISKIKRLKSATLSMARLPSGASVSLDYRINATSSTAWSEIFTESSQDAIVHEATNMETTRGEFDDAYEYEFRVRSTGFGEPIELKVVLDVTDAVVPQ